MSGPYRDPVIQRGWNFAEWGDEVLAELATPTAGALSRALALAPQLKGAAECLGRDTWRTFSALATLGAVDLTTARTLEPHVDALAILQQAAHPDLSSLGVTDETVWGVYAAHSPGHSLIASPSEGETWELSGSKPWCSLADRLGHALVTADVDGGRRLFAVRLDERASHTGSAEWAPRGLVDVTTVTLVLDRATAVPVGERDWYLSRPGFSWGGIGVAAVWFGAAAAVAGRLRSAAEKRRPDQIALAALGHADRTLYAALLCLRAAAHSVDRGAATGTDGQRLAARVRAVIADGAEEVVRTVGRALGPGPLAYDPEHARRIADLTLYLRQHHAERDLAALGALLIEER